MLHRSRRLPTKLVSSAAAAVPLSVDPGAEEPVWKQVFPTRSGESFRVIFTTVDARPVVHDDRRGVGVGHGSVTCAPDQNGKIKQGQRWGTSEISGTSKFIGISKFSVIKRLHYFSIFCHVQQCEFAQ